MTLTNQTNNFACHRLIDEQNMVHGPSIVCLDKCNGNVLSYSPFNYDEVPFVQWIGGTIILKDEPLQAWHSKGVNESEKELYRLR